MKKHDKKLRLARTTVRNLRETSLDTIVGGLMVDDTKVIQGCRETYAPPCNTVPFSCRGLCC